METCENCYHYDVCGFNEYKDFNEICSFFKDKSFIVELPCKVGDTLYILNYDTSVCNECPDYYSELEWCECLGDFDLFPDIKGKTSRTCPKHILQITEKPHAQLTDIAIWLKKIGTIVFTDKAKAEAKLKELEK